MHRYLRTLLVLCLVLSGISCCEAVPISIATSPQLCHIGEKIFLSGKTSIPNTIAVYLFLMGPGLDNRGVTLENLNLPAGQGYFTSAHVNGDGSWVYEWNTAFIAGRLQPGNYSVFVVKAPLSRDRIIDEEICSANITFTEPPQNPSLAMPYPALAILGIAGAAFLIRKKK
ncbi:MAG TPA: hypothetical protein VMW63_03385 [Methanoregulaceae archaeon]|nr:hypothetical protein [Methanoregulaceae archaeon]